MNTVLKNGVSIYDPGLDTTFHGDLRCNYGTYELELTGVPNQGTPGKGSRADIEAAIDITKVMVRGIYRDYRSMTVLSMTKGLRDTLIEWCPDWYEQYGQYQEYMK